MGCIQSYREERAKRDYSAGVAGRQIDLSDAYLTGLCVGGHVVTALKHRAEFGHAAPLALASAIVTRQPEVVQELWRYASDSSREIALAVFCADYPRVRSNKYSPSFMRKVRHSRKHWVHADLLAYCAYRHAATSDRVFWLPYDVLHPHKFGRRIGEWLQELARRGPRLRQLAFARIITPDDALALKRASNIARMLGIRMNLQEPSCSCGVCASLDYIAPSFCS